MTEFFKKRLCLFLTVILVFSGASLTAPTEVNAAGNKTELQTAQGNEAAAELPQAEAVPEAVISGSGTCGHNLTWELDSNGTLTISGSGDMEDYYWCGSPWNQNDTACKVRSIIIRNGVTGIGDYAFQEMENLQNIVLPESLMRIGEYAFNYCSDLKAIVLPEGLTSIENYTFGFCESLESVALPESLITIEEGAFDYCSSLSSIVLPEKLTSIDDYAFNGCSALTSIIIPASVNFISEDAFFSSNLKEFKVNKNNSSYSSLDGVLYNKAKTKLIVCPKKISGRLVIPNSVTEISNSGFYQCSELTGIVLPSGLTSIRSYMFAYCTGLVSVTIPDSVKSIEYGAFNFCTQLTDITLPSGLEVLDSFAFSNCTALKTIQLPGSLKTIYDGAFLQCSSLKSIIIPAGVTTIGTNVFRSCSNLTSIQVDKSNSSYCSQGGAVYNKNKTRLLFCLNTNESFQIPDSVTQIAYGAFGSCTRLTSVIMPSDLKAMESAVFEGCTNLKVITMSGNAPEAEWFGIGIPSSLIIYYPKGASGYDQWPWSSYDCRPVQNTPASPAISRLSNSSRGITITWSKISSATGYYVYRKSGSESTYTRVASIKSGSTTSWTDSKATSSGVKYTYCLKAYKTVADKTYSSAAGKVKIIYYLSQPSVSVSNAASGISVKWSKASGSTGYYIYRKAGSENTYSKVASIRSGSTVSWTDSKAMSNGKKYVYTVKAYKTVSGVTYNSSYTSGKIIYRLSRPSISSLTNSASKTFKVTWSKNSKASGYQVQYAVSDTFSNASTKTYSGYNTVTGTITGLTKGKTYYVRVRSCKTAGNIKYYSAWSPSKKVKISK